LRSWAIYGGNLRNALHRLKYKHDIALGDLFARALVECYLELGWQADLIAPVPLGLARLNERGYNQAALLARPLALALALPYRPNAVKRVRETHSQVNLSTQERLANVHDAFGAQRNLVAGRAVLMVDDIATTGATLNSCASALVAAGARNVYALTVARTPLEPEARLE
jgi:ComF family protein